MRTETSGGLRAVLFFIPAVAVALLAGCAEPGSDMPSAGDAADSGAVQQGGTTQDDLILASAKVALPPTSFAAADLPGPASQAQYVSRFCSGCHNVPSPAMHSATDWPTVLRRMWLRMERIDPAFGIPVPEVGDRLVMQEYMTANALRVGDENLPDLPGRETFETTCSQCHELADPAQHAAADWVAVVRRMSQHMHEILGQELDNERMGEIVQYLQAVSG